MLTSADAQNFVATAINAGDADASEYDVETICDQLREIAGSWDMDAVDADVFWSTVERNRI